MIQAGLKLAAYFGERDRRGGRLTADALHDFYESHGVHAAVIGRGVEGFGLKHKLRTEHLLTLSEDLPLVSVAVDAEAHMMAALPAVTAMLGDGLVYLERVLLLDRRIEPLRFPAELHEAVRITVFSGRTTRVGHVPTYRAVIEVLRRHGALGASVILGVDGMLHGARQRAHFFSRNANVPLMIVGLGPAAAIGNALLEVGLLLERPLITLESVRVCKRDGALLAEPRHLPEHDADGLPVWQKIMVHEHPGDPPLYPALIRRLRQAGAAGATTIRGVYGFARGERPRGDSFFSLRRTVPVHTIIVDRPSRVRAWWEIVDEVTARHGVVTSEPLPATRIVSGDQVEGGFQLAGDYKPGVRKSLNGRPLDLLPPGAES